MLVQTRAQRGEFPPTKVSGAKRKGSPNLERKEKVDAVTMKQRQSPLSSWIGKQLLGQQIHKRYLDGDGNLQQMMQGYPHGLLANPSDRYSGQKIVVTVEEQKSLIKSTYAEIHHQGRIKVHHVLYPLYYWPGMNATIEAVCTACAKFIRANRRRKKLNLDFDPASQKELLLPRQQYGIERLLRRAQWGNFGHGGFVLKRNHAEISSQQENGARVSDDHEADHLLTRHPG